MLVHLISENIATSVNSECYELLKPAKNVNNLS